MGRLEVQSLLSYGVTSSLGVSARHYLKIKRVVLKVKAAAWW